MENSVKILKLPSMFYAKTSDHLFLNSKGDS